MSALIQRDAAASPRWLRVGALVDPTLAAEAGGHVKCLQRFAEAVADCGERLDLDRAFLRPRAAPHRAVALGALYPAAAGISTERL